MVTFIIIVYLLAAFAYMVKLIVMEDACSREAIDDLKKEPFCKGMSEQKIRDFLIGFAILQAVMWPFAILLRKAEEEKLDEAEFK